MKRLTPLLMLLFCGCVTWNQVGMFVLGGVTAGVVHEGAHWGVGKAQGKDVHFHGLNWNVEGGGNTALQMSGLVANAVSSEIALRYYDGKTGFCEGLIAGNTLEEMSYPLRGKRGDFQGHVSSPDEWKAGFLVHGASVAARAGVKKYKEGWGLGLLPSREGGAMSLEYRW